MIETAAPELHDAILLCAGVSAVYLVVALLQLMQLKRRKPVTIAVREPSVGEPLPLEANAFSPSDSSFPEQLKRVNIEAGLKQLDVELERLRTELQTTRDELKLMRSERTVQGGPPLYNEAMSFARSGLSAVGIASRCGISMGEAELVAALARDPKDFGIAEDEVSQIPAENERHGRLQDGYRATA